MRPESAKTKNYKRADASFAAWKPIGEKSASDLGGNMATSTKTTAVREPFTKAQLLGEIAEETGLTKKDVAAVFDSLRGIMQRHLKPRAAGTFTLPGLLKLTVAKKPATKERKGVNPFTGEEMVFKAKPASRTVKARVLKGLKELAE